MEWQVWTAKAELAKEHLAELYQPFREASGNGGVRVFWQNLISEDLPGASVSGLVEVTDDMREKVAVLDLRGYAVANGRVVLAENQRQLAESFAKYLERQGLVEPNSIANAIFVKSPTEYVQVIENLAKQAAERGIKIEIVPYLQAGKLFDAAAVSGVPIYGSGRDVAHEVVDGLDKANYRDVIEALGGPLPYPRVTIHQGQAIGLREEFLLGRALDYVAAYGDSLPRKALFLQAVNSGGGYGNSIVHQNSDGTFGYQNTGGASFVFETPKQFLQHVAGLGFDSDITPFLKVTRSYSFGIIVADSGLTVFGPRHQVLDDKQNFMGWKINRSESEESLAPVREQMKLAEKLGVELWKAGFRGCLSEDLFEFRSPSGAVEIGRAEANVRRDATTLLTGLLLSLGKARDALLEGRMSIRQNDHFPISPAHGIKGVADLVAHLQKSGLPLLSADDPYGVVLISPPLSNRATGAQSAVLAIVGHDDDERDDLYRRLEIALG